MIHVCVITVVLPFIARFNKMFGIQMKELHVHHHLLRHSRYQVLVSALQLDWSFTNRTSLPIYGTRQGIDNSPHLWTLTFSVSLSDMDVAFPSPSLVEMSQPP
jgi:hypothetical protein